LRRLLLVIPLVLACSVLQPRPVQSPATLAAKSTIPAAVEPATTTPAPTATPPQAASLPDSARYQWSRVADGFRSPVDLQDAGDGRLFVVEQAGVIRLIGEDGGSQGVFLDLRARVGSQGNEQGLLGLALHPDFQTNGYFYINYTDTSGDTVIARFHADPRSSEADPASQHILLTYDQPYPNHNGGRLAFGPDGMLYIGAGDGGSAGDPEQRAQNPDVLLGKLLRIDVDGGDPYAVPPDNPFASQGGRPEIWALGLRNPWRFAFDPQTGDLYLGDVGQNRWEEVDYLPAGTPGGTNFGWDFREGFKTFEGTTPSGLTDPIVAYSHDQGCSITGGVVARDSSLPDWNGVYLYGDFCSGTIWGLLRTPAGDWQNTALFNTGFQITSFGVDAEGRIYVLDRAGGVYRLSPAS
jgi:glucose/arabinose dehydrogenase